MLAYSPHLLDASKEEIRWLKEVGVLGKRAPKSSLMQAAGLLQLLKDNNKFEMAALIQTAIDKFEVKRALKLNRINGTGGCEDGIPNADGSPSVEILSDSELENEVGNGIDESGMIGAASSSSSAHSSCDDDDEEDEDGSVESDDEAADESYEEPTARSHNKKHVRGKAAPAASVSAVASSTSQSIVTGSSHAPSTGSKRKNSTSAKEKTDSSSSRSGSRKNSSSAGAGGGSGVIQLPQPLYLAGMLGIISTSQPSPTKRRKGSNADSTLSGNGSPSLSAHSSYVSPMTYGSDRQTPLFHSQSSRSPSTVSMSGLNIHSPNVAFASPQHSYFGAMGAAAAGSNNRYSFSAVGAGGNGSRRVPSLIGSREVDEYNFPAAAAALASLPPELQSRLTPLGHCAVHPNPKDCSPASRSQGHTSSIPIIRLGSDHSLGMVVSSDGLSVQGPRGGSGTIRASHGISSGVWYIEVRGCGTRTSSPCSESNGMDEFNHIQQVQQYSPAMNSMNSGLDQDQPHCRVGFATLNSRLDFKLGQDQWSWSFDDRYGDRIHRGEAKRFSDKFQMIPQDPTGSPGNSESNQQSSSAILRRGDVIGMLLELDARSPPLLSASASSPVMSSLHPEQSTHRISFFKNNVCLGVAFEDLPRGTTIYPAASVSNGMMIQFDFYVADRAAQVQAMQQQTRIYQGRGNGSHVPLDESGTMLLPRGAHAALVTNMSPHSNRQNQQQPQPQHHRVLFASNRNPTAPTAGQQGSSLYNVQQQQMHQQQIGFGMMPPPAWPNSVQSVLLPAASLSQSTRAISSNAVILPSQQTFQQLPSAMSSLTPRAMSAYQPGTSHMHMHTQEAQQYQQMQQRQQQQLHQHYQQQQQQQQQRYLGSDVGVPSTSRSPLHSPDGFFLPSSVHLPTVKQEFVKQEYVKQEYPSQLPPALPLPSSLLSTRADSMALENESDLFDNIGVQGNVGIDGNIQQLHQLAQQLEQIQSWPVEERGAKLDLLQQQVQSHIVQSSHQLYNQSLATMQQIQNHPHAQMYENYRQLDLEQQESQQRGAHLQLQIQALQKRIDESLQEQNNSVPNMHPHNNIPSASMGVPEIGMPPNLVSNYQSSPPDVSLLPPQPPAQLPVLASPPDGTIVRPSFSYDSTISSGASSGANSTPSLAFSLRSGVGEGISSTATAMLSPDPSPPISPMPAVIGNTISAGISITASPIPSPIPMATFGSGSGNSHLNNSSLGVSGIGSACSSPIPALSGSNSFGVNTHSNNSTHVGWLGAGLVPFPGSNMESLTNSPLPLNTNNLL
jgi:hypothetical protein